ncbi:hypothetical protein LRAMOSA11140 [Lichtheimia ramosa]|uniref:Uncharacterized protein n=1 Tax=Lichtheimia ramosa TaxID=688394 RepID=A0A077WTN5_9FUNG|nr:hypothetical protein LRAMOSA11140 [Lichtheimia ramosa]
MSHPTWNDLCQLPALTASSERNKELVLNSTTKLQQSLESALSALDQRAMTLTKTANFDSALDDAKAIQQLSPTSALGYLRAASIYSEQGKQRRVIDICKKALRIVDPKDVHYAALQQAKASAKQCGSMRIDFIRRLPADVTTTTLLPMFINKDFVISYEPCQYLQVSTVWRDCFIQYLNGLHFSIFEYNHAALCVQVAELAQHTKTLHIDRYAKRTWLSDLLKNYDFCSLKEIDIDEFSSRYIDRFVSSLKSVNSTLTHLRIHIKSAPAFPVAIIISACTNLVSLDVMEATDADLSPLQMKPWSSMTTLCITCTLMKITFDEIVGIWRRFPSLKQLQLHPCTDIEASLVVTDYYPSMKGLKLAVSVSGVDFTCKEQGIPGEGIGISHLCLAKNGSPMSRTMNVNPVLKRYHNTLERIDLRMDLDTSDDMIDTIQYPRLKRIFFCHSAWWIPQNAPMLQELGMTAYTLNRNPAVLDTAPVDLQKLELRLHMDPLLPNKEPLERYLLRLAQQSQLKELTLDLKSVDHIGTLLDTIWHFHQLQSLVIRFRDGWSCYHMERFYGRLVQDCPCLSSLEMNCKNTPSTYVLNTIKELTYLLHFGFPIS